MPSSQQTLLLSLSRKRWDHLAEIAADEGLSIKQLLLLLIDEAVEDYAAGLELEQCASPAHSSTTTVRCSSCGAWCP